MHQGAHRVLSRGTALAIILDVFRLNVFQGVVGTGIGAIAIPVGLRRGAVTVSATPRHAHNVPNVWSKLAITGEDLLDC
jgi:hypothetical protein